MSYICLCKHVSAVGVIVIAARRPAISAPPGKVTSPAGKSAVGTTYAS
jgi:hypothetical protein